MDQRSFPRSTLVLGLIVLIGIILYFVMYRQPTMNETVQYDDVPSEYLGSQVIHNEQQKAMELQSEVIKEGTGEGAKNGNRVTVHYTGTLVDGTQFDSSLGRGMPFTFTLGAGDVIRGWDLGIVGMKVGESRRLIIPPELGYGALGTPNGPIPPAATLIFTVELLQIQ